MSLRIVGLIGLVAGIAGNVHAITCYEIIDASDNTLYRAAVPPFALEGSAWNNGQARLRAQGRHLMWFDTNICPENFSGTAYASLKPPEDATALLPSRRGFRGMTSGAIYTRETTGSGPAATSAKPAAAPMGAPSGGGTGYTR